MWWLESRKVIFFSRAFYTIFICVHVCGVHVVELSTSLRYPAINSIFSHSLDEWKRNQTNATGPKLEMFQHFSSVTKDSKLPNFYAMIDIGPSRHKMREFPGTTSVGYMCVLLKIEWMKWDNKRIKSFPLDLPASGRTLVAQQKQSRIGQLGELAAYE